MALSRDLLARFLEQSDEVRGWLNEIEPGLLLNYNLTYRKNLVQAPWIRAGYQVRGRLGSLYSDLTPGIHLEMGHLEDRGFKVAGRFEGKAFRAGLLAGLDVRAVAYDGTLTGSLFHPDKRFLGKVKPERVQLGASLGMQLGMPSWQLSLIWYADSPEFVGGDRFTYGSLTFIRWW